MIFSSAEDATSVRGRKRALHHVYMIDVRMVLMNRNDQPTPPGDLLSVFWLGICLPVSNWLFLRERRSEPQGLTAMVFASMGGLQSEPLRCFGLWSGAFFA